MHRVHWGSQAYTLTGHQPIKIHKVLLQFCTQSPKLGIYAWSVKIFAQDISSALLTHRESVVSQSHLSCGSETAAKPITNVISF